MEINKIIFELLALESFLEPYEISELNEVLQEIINDKEEKANDEALDR